MCTGVSIQKCCTLISVNSEIFAILFPTIVMCSHIKDPTIGLILTDFILMTKGPLETSLFLVEPQ